MERLKRMLMQIDGRGYKAYKDIQGTHRGEGFLLHIDHVQADPFASPSRIRVEIPGSAAGYPGDWYSPGYRKTALEDFIAREAAEQIRLLDTGRRGSGKSGLIFVDRPGQEILPRTAVVVSADRIEVRLSIGLPAEGRTVLGRAAAGLLCGDIPVSVKRAVLDFDRRRLLKHLDLADQQAAARQYLEQHQYLAFIANGSILPRASGVSDLPLRTGRVIPFQSPPSLETEIPVPHRQPLRGMAVPPGITLIVGGGYHGKSTLLKAIERGVYNHVAGDGREYVLTNPTAYKVRAEDGRRVEKVDISPFISELPYGRDTRRFSTEDASGSTSQAANIIEALEVGSEVLLIDEDTSATNFMIRDARMQELVSKDREPITPFIDRVRQLYQEHRVSTILVLGGSGDYFDVADTVVMMDSYQPVDVTDKAREISARIKTSRRVEGGSRFGEITSRRIRLDSINPHRGPREKADARGLHTIVFGSGQIDLSCVEQLVDPSQTRAIAAMLQRLAKSTNGPASLSELIDRLFEKIETGGLEAISPFYGKHPGDLAMPRRLDLAAALNRLRSLQVE